MSEKKIHVDEYEFIKHHWGLEDSAFNISPKVGWGDIVGIVQEARLAGREEGMQEQREKIINLLEARRPTIGEIHLANKEKELKLLGGDYALVGAIRAIRTQTTGEGRAKLVHRKA